VEAATDTSWQELLDRADSLAAVGNLDSVDVVVDEAMSKALTEYDRADTTVKVILYREGLRKSYYFHSYAEAESLCTRVLSIREKILGGGHPDVAAVLMDLASVYGGQRRYAEARPLYERALSIREEALDPEHPDVGRSLLGLAGAYRSLSDYDTAELFYKRSLSVFEQALDPEHPHVARSLNNLAGLYLDQGKYAEAEPLYRRALAIKEKTRGPEHSDVAVCLNNLAILYWYQGRYAEAERFYRRALAILEQVLGSEHPSVAGSLNNLAILCVDQGKYAEAEPLYKRALAIWEKLLGPEHPDVASNLDNLAILYEEQGKYAEAEPLYRRALAVREQALGPEHPNVGTSLNNLALLYDKQGKYAEAEPLHRRALAIWEQALGPEHPNVARSFHNLASLYGYQDKYAEAESLYRRSLAIKEQALGPEHPGVAHSLDGLAGLHSDQGKYAEAEPLYRRALAIWEQALGSEHPLVAYGLNHLAKLYSDQGKYAEAEPLFKRALTIREHALGPEHTQVALNLEAMCGLYRLQDRGSQAEELAGRACRIRQKNFMDNATVLSEKDALTYSQFLRNSVSNYLTCYSELGSTTPALVEQACDIVFSGKGQVSDEILGRQRTLAEETDSTTLILAESLRLAKFRLSSLFVEGPGENAAKYRSEVDSLTVLANELEADLSRHSASFRRQQDYKNISTARIASLLPENSALVEYVKYDYLQLEPEDEIPHYMVLVVTEAAEPVIVELGEADEIDAAVAQYRDHMLRVSSSTGMPTVVDEQDYERITGDLYSRIWEPIAEYLTEKDLVVMAPDGALNLVSFGGLVDPDGNYLVERYLLHALSSGRDVIRLKDEMEPGIGLFALGDPDYDASAYVRLPEVAALEDTVLEIAYYATRNVRSGCGDLKDMRVSPLPGTRGEIEEIALRWRESTGETLTACLGMEASEEKFKSEAPGKRVIHLATHGYFLEGRCRSELSRTDLGQDISFVGENPLLLSGLFFAGANLHGEGADSLGAEDGILTAYEVSAMDLEGTELVVLSACETGLGRVEEGEGVYGLRRAFQMAGARTVISALWPVSDEATAEMMSQLYERRTESLPETMRRIQLDRINELRSDNQTDHPFTWGAFIALGDWR
jgi:tetratricopeptide (TPR) repeat protein/CHAT domain-containing protein